MLFTLAILCFILVVLVSETWEWVFGFLGILSLLLGVSSLILSWALQFLSDYVSLFIGWGEYFIIFEPLGGPRWVYAITTTIIGFVSVASQAPTAQRNSTSNDSHSVTAADGVGPKLANVLYDAGFETKSDLRNASENDLVAIDDLGTDLARHLAKHNRIDDGKRVVATPSGTIRFDRNDIPGSKEGNGEKSKKDATRQEKEEQVQSDQRQDPISENEPFDLIERPDVGRTFTAEIDRISDSGNGIVETEDGHINIGPVTEDAVGKKITAEMEDNQFARILTESVRAGDTKESDKQDNKRESKVQRKVRSIRSDLSEIESLISNAKLQKATERLRDVESQLDSLEQTYTDYLENETAEELRQSVSEKQQELQQKERRQKHQEEIQSIRSELSEINSLISDTELQKANSRLDDIEVQLNRLEQRFSDYESEKIDELRQSVSESRQKLQQKEYEKKIQEKIHSIHSDLTKVDSLATNAEFQQASQLLDDIESHVSELKLEDSQVGFGTLKTEIQQLEQDCDDRLSKPRILRQLREMDPYEFEKLVAKIWGAQGWDAEATSGSTDRGVDVVATKEDAFEKRRHLIQVKRHGENTTVGSEDIQRYASLYQRDEQVDNVFVVTSNRFTSEAKEVAKRRDVSIVNGDELYEMLTET